MVIDKVSSGYSANPSYQVLKSFKKKGSIEALHGTVTLIPQRGESITYLR
jgi:hypothetical protein